MKIDIEHQKRMQNIVSKIDDCIKNECELLKKEANPRESIKCYARHIKWESPGLAEYIQKKMLAILNLNN